MRKIFAVFLICLIGPGTQLDAQLGIRAETIDTSIGALKLTKMAGGLKEPWAVAFLNEGRFVVSERRGKLWLFDGQGGRRSVSGVPEVFAHGQGGLLDVLAANDYSTSAEIFLTYARVQGSHGGTALAVAKLDTAAATLHDLRILFEMKPGTRGGNHFGSRVVEARDGSLFITVGERGDRDLAQDLSWHNGSVVRISRDGAIPADNPFIATKNALPQIWSFGHRNPQGAALDAMGQLWIAEHGAKGGDEINRIMRGGNYGWPVISYGTHYSGGKIGLGTRKAGLEQPVFYWDPSIAPSGMMIYSGKMFPEWRGDFFIGSLKFDYIARLDKLGTGLNAAEQLKARETLRVRDVREAPDGSIWFLSVKRRGLYRISR